MQASKGQECDLSLLADKATSSSSTVCSVSLTCQVIPVHLYFLIFADLLSGAHASQNLKDMMIAPPFTAFLLQTLAIQHPQFPRGLQKMIRCPSIYLLSCLHFVRDKTVLIFVVALQLGTGRSSRMSTGLFRVKDLARREL